MASGGARTRSGPPPDPGALRRGRGNDEQWTTLPAEGRAGDPPPWPLTKHSDPEAAEREMELWARLWATPQATQWERMGQEVEVALYVRRLAEAEQPGATANLATLVRQMADALGLTIPGLRVNRWRIAGEPQRAPRKAAAAESDQPRRSARDRFTVIHGEAG